MSYEIQIFLNSIAGLICNDFGKSKGLYVFMPFVYVSFKCVINGSSWIGWSLGDAFHFLTMVATSMDPQTFSTMRYFPPRDIFRTSDILGHKEFSTQRHSWLQLFPPQNIFSNEAFSKPKTFSATRHFQLQFLGFSKKLKSIK